MRLFSLLLLSTFATIFSSAALLLTLPGNFAAKALWMSLAVPLIWLGFMFYAYWDERRWRVVVLPLVAITVGAGVVFTTAPQI